MTVQPWTHGRNALLYFFCCYRAVSLTVECLVTAMLNTKKQLVHQICQLKKCSNANTQFGIHYCACQQLDPPSAHARIKFIYECLENIQFTCDKDFDNIFQNL